MSHYEKIIINLNHSHAYHGYHHYPCWDIQLRDMKITDIGVYYESKHEQDIKIEVMDFVDDDKQLVFSPPELIQEGCVTVD